MATDAISALGAGSGIDVKALATSLVDAERVPKKEQIDKKISKSEANISGYSAIKYVLGELKTSFGDLKDLSDFSSIQQTNSQPSAFTAVAGSSTVAGMHSVEVSQLAKAQRSVSSGTGFATETASLSGTDVRTAFKLVLGGAAFPVGADGEPQRIEISTADDSPAGVVAAINNAQKGISAQLLKTSDSPAAYKILLSGGTGLAKAFTISAEDDAGLPISGLAFDEPVQAAQDAKLKINGVDIQASSNRVEGAITGVTLNLTTLTQAGPATLDFSQNTSPVKTRIQALVTAFNDVNSLLGIVADPESTVELYGASLVGNSSVNQVRNQMRDLITSNSSTPSGSILALRDLGLSMNRDGELVIDNAKLDTALEKNFDDVVNMLSGRQENLSIYNPSPAGVANNAFNKITQMISSTGTLNSQSVNASKRITSYQAELVKLEARMASLLERYTKQFGTMESIVGQANSMRASLTSTFEGMMAAYTNN